MKPKPPTPLTDQFMADMHIRLGELKVKKSKLARDIGTSRQTLNRWFHGLRAPTGEFVLRMIQWLKRFNIL